MLPADIVISFITSVAAGLATPLIDKFSKKNLEERMHVCFQNALWKWSNTDAFKEGGCMVNDYSDLQPYLADPASANPSVRKLMELLKEEIYSDEICKAALDDYQHTLMLSKLHDIESVVTDKKESFSDDSFEKKHDLRLLTQLMEAFSFPLMDEFSRDDPGYIRHMVVGCYDVWTEILSASTFKLYDQKLSDAINGFYSVWKEAIELGCRWYSPADDGTSRYKFFGLVHDDFTTPEAERAFLRLVDLKLRMQPLLKNLADHIHDNYRIDLDTCALKAFTRP